MKRLTDCLIDGLTDCHCACTVLAVLLAVLMSGCMWSRARINDPAILDRARAIRPGVTKADELPAILKAQPTRKRPEGGLVTYEYSYSDTKSKTFTLILVTFSRTEDVTETLYVETDAATGVVTRVPKLVHHEPEWRWWPFGEENAE